MYDMILSMTHDEVENLALQIVPHLVGQPFDLVMSVLMSLVIGITKHNMPSEDFMPAMEHFMQTMKYASIDELKSIVN